MEYYISTINFSPKAVDKISEVLPRMIDKGIKNIEISSFHPYEDNLYEYLQYYSSKVNILLHNFTPCPPDIYVINLSSRYKEVRDKCRNLIIDRMEFSKLIGSDYYSFHAGFRVEYDIHEVIWEYKNRISRKKALDLFIDEINKILDVAEDTGVHIGIENHLSIKERMNDVLLYELDDWRYLFDNISSKYLHMHLDLGHLKISSNQHGFSRMEFIKEFGKHVMGMHIHDNVGMKCDSHSAFDINNFWFDESYMKNLQNTKYMCLETISFADMDLIKDMLKYLRINNDKVSTMQ